MLIDVGAVPEDRLTALETTLDGAPASLLALRHGDRLQVWHNACPHAGRRLDYAPGRFLMQDGRLVCAAHGAQFRLDDGRCVEGPGRGGGLAALVVTRVADGWWVSSPPP